MYLNYRGNTYQVPTRQIPDPSISDVKNAPQSKITLIYRGNTFEYEPKAISEPEPALVDAPTVTLYYRGHAYERQLRAPKPYEQPKAMNWRWKVS
jgi:Domain of unknown function (DUF4278)